MKQQAVEFMHHLDDLWLRKSAWVRKLVAGPGSHATKKTYTVGICKKKIDQMLEACEDLFVLKMARRELYAVTLYSHQRKITGHGYRDRFERMYKWALCKFSGPIIYMFWKGNRCLYVGRGDSPKRLRAYRKSYYLKATTLEVFRIQSKSQLSKAECLAVHLYEPKDNAIWPASRKWHKKCPVCNRLKKVEDELEWLFSS